MFDFPMVNSLICIIILIVIDQYDKWKVDGWVQLNTRQIGISHRSLEPPFTKRKAKEEDSLQVLLELK